MRRKIKRKKSKLIVKLGVLFLSFYVIFLFISQQLKIQEKKTHIIQMNDKLSGIQNENRQLERIIQDESNYDKKESKSKVRIFENIL